MFKASPGAILPADASPRPPSPPSADGGVTQSDRRSWMTTKRAAERRMEERKVSDEHAAAAATKRSTEAKVRVKAAQRATTFGGEVKVLASGVGQVSARWGQRVQDAVRMAGCKWTATRKPHEAREWFKEWSEKARAAQYIVVLFTAEYKRTFRADAALRREAELVHELYESGQAAAKRALESAEAAREEAMRSEAAAAAVAATVAEKQALVAIAKSNRKQALAKSASASRAALAATRVYILGEATEPADLSASLVAGSPTMGSIADWWSFCCDQQGVKGEGEAGRVVQLNETRLNGTVALQEDGSDEQEPISFDVNELLGTLDINEANAAIGIRPYNPHEEPLHLISTASSQHVPPATSPSLLAPGYFLAGRTSASTSHHTHRALAEGASADATRRRRAEERAAALRHECERASTAVRSLPPA